MGHTTFPWEAQNILDKLSFPQKLNAFYATNNSLVNAHKMNGTK
jgi:hypothetical protein